MKKIFPFSWALEDDVLRLRLMQNGDIESLKTIAFDAHIWEFFTVDITDELTLRNWVQGAVFDYMNKNRVPFVIEIKENKQVVGSTSFGNISERDSRLEIGWTWLGVDFQGRGINQRVKKLLLQFAFSYLEVERVEFKTDVLNIQSRTALKKIGAIEEGILRSHTLMPNNRRRDTVYFSVLKEEWEGANKKGQ
jgi:RimJ/RimL family protein N-acetyltransferase